MRKNILTTIALLPLLLSLSTAEQNWAIDSPEAFGIPSEDSGTTAYLGVDIVDITSDRLGALKLKEEQGVEVTMVDQDAPAGKAGIKEHDVILTMNGTAVESKSQLQRMIHETPAGRVVALGLSRDGQPMTIKVQPNIGVVYVHSSMRSGVMVENLTPQLSEFFGAKSGSGVLVRSVEKGSHADKAGLRAGDVIIRVGEQFVHDTSDFTHALRSRNAGAVNVTVIRDKKEQTLTLTLPENKESGEMIEESFDVPELDAETQTELSKVQDEIANLRPQMEFAREETRRASELAREEAHKASEQVRKSVCDQQKQMREQSRKMRQELQKSREKLQKEMEEFRLQVQGNWMDI
jgi:membrane-associated protease RseP (regulator of RpoE activity)